MANGQKHAVAAPTSMYGIDDKGTRVPLPLGASWALCIDYHAGLVALHDVKKVATLRAFARQLAERAAAFMMHSCYRLRTRKNGDGVTCLHIMEAVIPPPQEALRGTQKEFRKGGTCCRSSRQVPVRHRHLSGSCCEYKSAAAGCPFAPPTWQRAAGQS